MLAGQFSDKRSYPRWVLDQNSLAKTNSKIVIASDYCFKFQKEETSYTVFLLVGPMMVQLCAPYLIDFGYL